jgi:predicted dehydrogenase
MLDHLPRVPIFRLAAVQDANPGLAAQVAERYASPWHGERFEDLLAAPGVDAVVISTPNTFHVPQAQAALRAGKPVLCQKPLATAAGDARAALDLAKALGQVLFVDYSYRLLDTAAALRSALPAIGAVRAVSAAFHNIHGPGADRDWFIDPKRSGGGALIDLGVHVLDMVLWLLEPREVRLERAMLDRRPERLVESGARLEVRLDEVPLTVDVSWDAPKPLTEINVVVDGAGGQARWDNVGGSFTHFRTQCDGRLLIDQERALRENTLNAFAAALASGSAPRVDTRVYDLLDQAYGRA